MRCVSLLEVGQVSGVERKARSLGKQCAVESESRQMGGCNRKPAEICTIQAARSRRVQSIERQQISRVVEGVRRQKR